MTPAPRPPGRTIRFAALDLDGTLVDTDGRPYDDVERGLRALRDRGVTPVLVTGRAARTFRNLRHLTSLLDLVDDEVLLSEGNSVLARRSDTLTCTRTCPPAVARALLGVPEIDLVVERDGEFSATTARAALQFAMTYRLPRSQVGRPVPATLTGPAPTAFTVFQGDRAIRNAVAGTECELTTLRSFDAWSVRPQGTCKASALADHLRRRFGEPDLRRTLAVGDGVADARMLSACAVGVAPDGAHPAAAAAATVRPPSGIGAFLGDFDPLHPCGRPG